MSEEGRVSLPVPERSFDLGYLADRQDARVVHDPTELAASIWDSDEELEAFLADLRASRNASLG